MRRIFFGICAIGSGLCAVHFMSRWFQIRDTTGCFTDADCQRQVMRGGENQRDKQLAIGLFAVAAICIWLGAGKDH